MFRILVLLLFVNFLFGGVENYKTGTWNLQGSSTSSEAKWNVNIRQMVSGQGSLDILAVQEAGMLPPSAVATGVTYDNGSGVIVSEYMWNLGTASRPQNVFIYFAPTDPGANRVNLALVSRMRADQIFLLPTPITASRPILGIRIGQDAFFSAHALANGGTDAPAIVATVDDFFRSRTSTLGNISWMILGDFNREPNSLSVNLELATRLRTRIVFVDAVTQVSARATLDYAVVGESGADLVSPALASIVATTAFALLRSHLTSDHFPVRFGKFE